MDTSIRAQGRGRLLGLSLVETTMTLAILAIGITAAVPTFGSLRQQRILQGHADQLLHDLQYARSEALSRNRSVRVSFFEASGDGGCYVLHTGPAGSCECGEGGVPVCNADGDAIRGVRLPSRDGVSLNANTDSILFHPLRGTSTPTATLRLDGPAGDSLQHVVNVMGRIRSCVPQGSVSGYRPC